MNETRPSRRQVLTAAGTGLLGSVAGCAVPGADGLFGNGDSSANPDPDFDRADRADGSVYSQVYGATIDSVTFVRVFGVEDPVTGQDGRGQGSGFVYDENHVVTNEHVVAGGEEVDLQYTSGDWSGATVVGTDVFSDLAVLEVDARPDGATPIALSERLPAVGQEVLAIGNPLGLEGSMTTGVVSGINRSLPNPVTEFSIPNAVQTDAPVNPGNSGGPLVDLEGEVVGVVTAGSGDNIGFAVSSALARRVIPALVTDGEYRHSLLGVRLVTVDPLVARANDLPAATGVLIVDVLEGGPADGVLLPSEGTVSRHDTRVPVGGDVVVAIDGVPIPDQNALARHLALETSPGDAIAIDVRRDGERRTVELTLGVRRVE